MPLSRAGQFCLLSHDEGFSSSEDSLREENPQISDHVQTLNFRAYVTKLPRPLTVLQNLSKHLVKERSGKLSEVPGAITPGKVIIKRFVNQVYARFDRIGLRASDFSAKVHGGIYSSYRRIRPWFGLYAHMPLSRAG